MKTPKCSHPITVGIDPLAEGKTLATPARCFAKASQRIVTSSRIVFRCADHEVDEGDGVFRIAEDAA